AVSINVNGPEPLARAMLAEARDLVSAGWCQGTSARAKYHEPVTPWADAACEWSLMGALAYAWHRRRSPRIQRAVDDPVFGGYLLASEAVCGVVHEAPQSWNDDPHREAADVLAALDAALRAVTPAAIK